MSIRICEIVTNLKNDKGEDLINLDNMIELLVNRECILKYAYIIHDKDTYTLEDESLQIRRVFEPLYHVDE